MKKKDFTKKFAEIATKGMTINAYSPGMTEVILKILGSPQNFKKEKREEMIELFDDFTKSTIDIMNKIDYCDVMLLQEETIKTFKEKEVSK